MFITPMCIHTDELLTAPSQCRKFLLETRNRIMHICYTAKPSVNNQKTT